MATKKKEFKEEEHLTLDKVMSQSNSQYGDSTMFVGSGIKKDVPRIPFGVFTPDYATAGGVPLWGTACLWGPPSGGKSSLAVNSMKAAGEMCWRCFHPAVYCTCSKKPMKMKSVFADIEGTFDQEWAEHIGANPESFLVALADYGEQYINIMEHALRADDCGLVIGDSLAALTPAAEFEAPSEDQFIGLQARMITRCCRKLKQRLIREHKRGHPCAVIFTNQLRVKIGVMFGDPETMAGGNALQHEFSLLLRCAKRALEKGGSDKKFIDASKGKDVATRQVISIRKEKVLTLAGSAEYVRVKENLPDLDLTKGMIDDLNTMMNYAKEYGVVEKDKDKWKYFDHTAKDLESIKNVWRQKFTEYLRTDMEIITRAKARLKEK